MWALILEGAAKLVDAIGGLYDTSSETLEAKAAAIREKVEALKVQIPLLEAAIKVDMAQMSAQMEVIKAEAASSSWLARNWRPIAMIMFLFDVQYVFLAYMLSWPVPPESVLGWVFGTLGIGLNGYILGRSAEKAIPKIAKALKAKEEL
jgi:hypothetical protein